ncbi:MAG: sulfotransferase [Streptosporangiales bacterium]
MVMAESAAALGNPGYGWPRPPAPTTSEPIIILTFSHSGAEILTEALARSALLACTARTGVLPLCEAVASTWQRVERRQHLSALAIASIRSLVTSMAIARTLESGALRWCETATSGAGSAATFLKIFPKTKFICFHRRADEVIEEAIANNPWGFGKTEFWPYSSAEPGNSLAMAGAYWAESSQSILDFQAAQPQACLSLRREDLEADAPEQMRLVWPFLGLTPPDAVIRQRPDPVLTEHGARPRFPADRLPPRLRTVINELHARLGYPPLSA